MSLITTKTTRRTFLANGATFVSLPFLGSLLPGTISGLRLDTGSGYELLGGLASLKISADDPETHVLPALLNLEWSDFASSKEIGRNYARAAYVVRCLLADRCGPASAAAFRSYLAGVAQGSAAASEALRSELDRSWPRIEVDYKAYVRDLAQQYDLLPTPTPL